MEQIDSSNYVEKVLRTESIDFEKIRDRIRGNGALRLLHASEGMQTESAEFTDMLKKHLFYGKEFNRANAIEEVGDLMWYVGVACDELGVSLDSILQMNIEKLAKRYPNKFTEEDAINRNVEHEMSHIEAKAK